jgi:hypothetical protein
MFEKLSRLLAKAQEQFQVRDGSNHSWRESSDICALADAERHLGHAIWAGKCWIAYDAMHLNPSGNGFRIIGTFAMIDAAKQAIEDAAGMGSNWSAGASIEPVVSVHPRHPEARSAR